MNQTAAILLMYLMFGQFMILMCGAFLLWWMGDFGGRRFEQQSTQPAGKAAAVVLDAKPATGSGDWLVPLTDDHSIAPRVAAEALEHDNDAAPVRDQAVRA